MVLNGNSATGQGWINAGGATTASSDWVWSLSGGQRIALSNWQLDGANQNPSRSNTGTFITPSITMSTYHTANFVSGYQYYLTVTGGNNVAYGTPSQTSDNWYDSGTNTTVSSDWVWNTVAGQSRYAVTTWTLNGFNQYPVRFYAGTATTASIPMTATHPLTFINTTQYYLTPTFDSNTTMSPSIATWIDSGKFQDFTYAANSPYAVTQVLIDGVSTVISTDYNFTNILTYHTIQVSSGDNYTVSFAQVGNTSPLVGVSPLDINIVVFKNGH